MLLLPKVYLQDNMQNGKHHIISQGNHEHFVNYSGYPRQLSDCVRVGGINFLAIRPKVTKQCRGPCTGTQSALSGAMSAPPLAGCLGRSPGRAAQHFPVTPDRQINPREVHGSSCLRFFQKVCVGR